MSDADEKLEFAVEEFLRGISDDVASADALRPTAVELSALLRIARSGDADRIARARKSVQSSLYALAALGDLRVRARAWKLVERLVDVTIALAGRAV